MDLALRPEELRFREEVRAFARSHWPSERRFLLGRSESVEDYSLELAFRRAMADRGWFVMDWPAEFGGAARSPIYRFLLSWELFYWGAPYHVTALNLVAPILMKYGSDRQKRDLLPRIARGEIDFSLGYTEPGAGSDLASLVTRAERTADGYLINGQKLYTSYVKLTDYIWLAARTDPTANKRQGISLFVVDKRLPGISITPLPTMDGSETYITHYDDVLVPADSLVGEPDRGWGYILEALNEERVALFPVAQAVRIFEDLRDRARTEGTSALRRRLAELWPTVEGATLLAFRCAWQAERGEMGPADAAKLKVLVTELLQKLARVALDLGMPYGERLYFATIMQTFGGGATEVLKDLIGFAGLGLPRE